MAGAVVTAMQAAAVDEPPIVVPFFASRPRQFPINSVFADDRSVPMASGSPHRPSREQPWYPYVRSW